MDNLQAARDIAIRDLRANYCSHGILASLGNWSQIWVRDSLYASLGAMAIGDIEIVKTNLATILRFQKKDGQIPLRIGGSGPVKKLLLRLIGKPIQAAPGSIRLRLVPTYRLEKPPFFPLPFDGNALAPIVVYEYMKKTKDRAFVEENFQKLELAMKWLIKRFRNGLVWQGRMGDWADCLMRHGSVLYTNVLTYAALDAMGKLCKTLGKEEEKEYYAKIAKSTKGMINQRFWQGEYYYDALPSYMRFSTDGNVLAIVFGVASRQQGKAIQKYIEKNQICSVPCSCNFPPYPPSKTDPLMALYGIPDYQTSLSWLWLGCLSAIGKAKMGMKKPALEEIKAIAAIIVKHNGVYEVYNQEGNPANEGHYKSETPFAWSSGLFLYANHLLIGRE